MGFIIILSISGTIFQNIGVDKISTILPDAPFDDVIQLTTGTHSAIYKSLDPELQVQVVQQITLALRNVFVVMLAGSALAFVGAAFLKVSAICLRMVTWIWLTNCRIIRCIKWRG
jgi:hypothetical protein